MTPLYWILSNGKLRLAIDINGRQYVSIVKNGTHVFDLTHIDWSQVRVQFGEPFLPT